jgi:hypothetical protein
MEGSGSEWPKNLRIRIRNTECNVTVKVFESMNVCFPRSTIVGFLQLFLLVIAGLLSGTLLAAQEEGASLLSRRCAFLRQRCAAFLHQRCAFPFLPTLILAIPPNLCAVIRIIIRVCFILVITADGVILLLLLGVVFTLLLPTFRTDFLKSYPILRLRTQCCGSGIILFGYESYRYSTFSTVFRSGSGSYFGSYMNIF